MPGAEIVLVTHSTRPRGGVVHTLAVAEALLSLGERVRIVALGDPAEGFFRPTTVPHVIVPAPTPPATLEARVAASVDALTEGLVAALGPGGTGPVSPHIRRILHAQDCIAARAAMRLQTGAARPATAVVRTVHHVDDFTSEVLVECQRRSILDPDLVLVVSAYWAEVLAADFGVDAGIVPNGWDRRRFPVPTRQACAAFRNRCGAAEGQFLVLTVGGIEPRKGTIDLLGAMAVLRRQIDPPPVLAVVGGHSYQDHDAYRGAALGALGPLGLKVGRDVVLLGTVSDADLAAAYGGADAFAFPSTVEGFGLAVLEAGAAGLPLVTSDIPVFREYLRPETDALMVPAGDGTALAAALARIAGDRRLRDRLAGAGRTVAARFTWEASARCHLEAYARLARRG